MDSTPPAWVTNTLSAARFAPYLAKSNGDTAAALRLYWWNLEISAAFHFPLHCIELALRNALHSRLCDAFSRDDWWAAAPLTSNGLLKIAEARSAIARLGIRKICPDDLVAQLTFGFWVSLISSKYHRTLWIPALHRAFPHGPASRHSLHRDFQYVLTLRNRIMHFEPIHHRHLAADHATIYRLLGHISPEMTVELRRHDSVLTVLRRQGTLHQDG
jgi:hypothetical protein